MTDSKIILHEGGGKGEKKAEMRLYSFDFSEERGGRRKGKAFKR